MIDYRKAFSVDREEAARQRLRDEATTTKELIQLGRSRVKAIDNREALHERYGRIWSEEEFRRAFSVLGAIPPNITVTRRSDGVTGLIQFQDTPRYYFGFVPSWKG